MRLVSRSKTRQLQRARKAYPMNFHVVMVTFLMLAVWAVLSIVAFGPRCASRGWRRNRALTAVGALVSVGAYLAMGILIWGITDWRILLCWPLGLTLALSEGKY